MSLVIRHPLYTANKFTATVAKSALYDAYFDAGVSRLNLPVLMQTAVYAQVDLAGSATYGGVYESHERLGGLYNNILMGVSR